LTATYLRVILTHYEGKNHAAPCLQTLWSHLDPARVRSPHLPEVQIPVLGQEEGATGMTRKELALRSLERRIWSRVAIRP